MEAHLSRSSTSAWRRAQIAAAVRRKSVGAEQRGELGVLARLRHLRKVREGPVVLLSLIHI